VNIRYGPPLQTLLNAIGWATLTLLAGFLIWTNLQVTKTPFPIAYGEGIMAWGSQEVSQGRWPYGDIGAVPSRYSAYGPATYTLGALLASILPEENPLRYVQAGRLLNLLSWLIGTTAIGLCCQKKTLGIGATALTLLAPVAYTLFFWAYRIDGVLFACQALLALTLIRAEKHTLWIGTIGLIVLLTLIKPPAAVDIIPLCLAALALRGPQTPKENLKILWRPLSTGAVLAPFVFFTLDGLSGFQMGKNILWNQSQSGLIGESNYLYNVGLWLETETLPLLVSSCAGLVVLGLRPPQERRPGLLMLAITLSFTIAALTCLKKGADVNYILPSLIPLGLSTSYLISKIPNLAPLLLGTLIPFLGLNPIIHESFQDYLPSPTCTETFKNLQELHNQENFLSEEIFYSVAAKQQPLVTDIFQTTLHYQQKRTPPYKLIAQATNAWGGWRLCDFLGAELHPTKPKITITTDKGKKKFPITPLAPHGPWGDCFSIKIKKTLPETVRQTYWAPNKEAIPAHKSLLLFVLPTLATLSLLAIWLYLCPPKIPTTEEESLDTNEKRENKRPRKP
jgi:hypothetical protein